jgi:citrate lyase subunit beta/citryl-CoA lyase
MANASLPSWRSLLFVPLTRERFIEKAPDAGADAIILDLEDSVGPNDKEAARRALPDAAKRVSAGGADVVVRVNRPWRMLVQDLEAAIIPGVAALTLPKVESAEHVGVVAEIIDELEAERGIAAGTVQLEAVIETASGFLRVAEIARAHPRLVALSAGSEDLALSLGMLPEPEGLFYPKQQCLIAARAAGLLPLGFVGTVADYKNLDAYRAMIRRSRRLGFVGAACIHPSNVAILNEEFAPSTAEIDHAERMIAAYGKALAEGKGSVEFEGKMIDIPVVERARQLLAHAAAIGALVTSAELS